jgi:hypothetical protein
LLEELSKSQMTALMSSEKRIGKLLGKNGPYFKRQFLQNVMNFANETDERTNKMVEQHSIDKVIEYERKERALTDDIAAKDAGPKSMKLNTFGGRKTRKKRKTRKRR